jgi:hypothetical protein
MLNVPGLDQDSKRRQSLGDAANQSMLGEYEMVDPYSTPRRRYRGNYQGVPKGPPVDHAKVSASSSQSRSIHREDGV